MLYFFCHIWKYSSLKPSAPQGKSSSKISAQPMEELTSKHTDRDTDAHIDLHPITLEEGLMEWRGGVNFDI